MALLGGPINLILQFSQTGYRYIAGTGDGITPKLATKFYFPNDVVRPTASTNAQHIEVLLSPNNQLTVYLRQATNAQFLCFVADLSAYTRPSNLKLGFTAGTGGNAAFHELQNVFINATVGIPWDNTSGDSLWATAANWHPDGLPVAGSEITFDNTYVHSAQTIDLGNTTRTVRGLSFDAGFAYNLVNGTLYFNTNTEPPGRFAISQSGVNGNGNMTIAANIQTSDDLTVDNSALGTLFLNGNMDLQSHVAYFSGMGAITVNGTISGAGQVVNYRALLTLTNNTYSGGTLLQNGTTLLAADQAMGPGNVFFTGGTLLAANGARVITNTFLLQGTNLAIGGALPLTFSGSWSQTNGNSILTVNNTAQTRFSGGIVLAENNQTRTLTLNVATTTLVDSVITNGPGSGPDGLTKAGLGTLTLSASNGYSGLTTVSAGTLALGASERLRDISPLMLAGGTLNLAGYTETVAGLGYTNGALDFGTGGAANYLMFATNLASGGSLVIFNFQAGVDHIAFQDTNTLSDAFLNGIYFSGYGVGATVTAGSQTIPGYPGSWKFIEPAAGLSTWDGGSAVDSNWSTPANWVGDVQPSSGPGVNVTFEGTPPRLAPELNTSRTVGQLRFNTNAAAFTLLSTSGSTLTLDGTIPGISQQSAQNEVIGHGLALATNTIFDTVGAGVLTVSGAISGAGGIAKYSSGELSLTASNSYAGSNLFYNGLVNIQHGSALGSTNAGTRVLGTATLEIAGNINVGAEPLSLNSPGFNNEGAICNESGSNSYAGTITLEGPSRINTDAGSLTLSGIISNNLAGAWDLTVGGNGSVILSNVLATGTGALTKDGAGTLTLKGAGANIFSGTTTVAGGLLELGKTAGVIAVGGNLQIGDDTGADTVRLLARDQISDAASVTLASSGLLDLNGYNETIANLNAASSLAAVHLGAGTLTVSGFDNSIFGGVISGAGALVKTSAGTLILTGPNTYAGATTISGGVVRIEHNTALGNVTAAATVASGAALELKDGLAVGVKPLSLAGSGIGGTGGGALRNIAGDNSWAGRITLTAGATISSDAGTLSLSGVIAGPYPLTKTGVGSLTLSGLNTYTGGTTNSAGTLSVAISAALGLESNPLTISAGAVLKATDSFNTSRSTTLGGAGDGVGGTFEVDAGKTLDYTSSSVIGGTGSLIKTGAGTLSLGGVDTYTGGTYIKAGTLVSTSGRAPGPQPPAGSNLYAHHIYDGATLQIAVGSWSTERQVELVGDQVGSGGAAIIDIVNGFTQQRNGLIYGAGRLDLLGTGTMIVTGTNTYSGGTIIEHGVFQANNSTGSATGTGAVTVRNGGTLSGLPTAQGAYAGITGSASGAVEIQSTGNLLARSGGTLSLGGLALDAGASATFQLGAPTAAPLVNVTTANALTLPGASTIEIVNSGALAVGTYHLFDYTGTALSGLSHLTLASSHSGSFNLALVNNTANTSIDLEVTAITDQWKKGGVDTYWSTAGNWWGAQPNGTGAGAQFLNNNGVGFAAAETTTLDASKTLGSLAFNNTATAFTIAAASSQTLTLDQSSGNAVIQVFSAPGTASHVISAPVILADDLTVTIASGTYGLDLGGAISGTGKALTKTDSGPLTLSGSAPNTYTGLTEVDGGTLNLNKTPGTDAISSGGLQIDFGATAALLADNQVANSATVTVNGSFNLGSHYETLAALGGGGVVTVGSGGVLTLASAADSMFIGTIGGAGALAKAGAGTLTLNGTNTYAGGTTISAGALQVGADHNLGDSSGEVAFGGGTLFFSGSLTSGRNMLLNPGGGTFDTDGSGVTLAGEIRGEGTLTKVGTGTVKLSGANIYTGATIINNGILRIGHATSLGTAAAGTTINPGGEIEIEGSSLTVNEPLSLNGGELCNLGNINTYGGPITLTANSGLDADDGTLIITSVMAGSYGPAKSGPGTIELTGENTYTGTTTISEGTLSVATIGNGGVAGNLGQGSKAAANLIFDGGTLRYTGLSAATDRDFTINEGKTAMFEVAANTLTWSGASAATAGSLTKTGAGTLTLSGPGAHTGGTTIASGVLKVNNTTGSATGTGTVTVASGATLGGTGTAAGPINLNGTLAPGDGGVGTLSTGPETWNGGATNLVEINDATGTPGADPGWDLLNITGTLTVSATTESKFTLKVVSLTGSSPGPAAHFDHTADYKWRIATASGGVTGFDVGKIVLETNTFANAQGLGHFLLSQSGTNLYLEFVHLTARPLVVGRAWGTFLRIPKADVLAQVTGGSGAPSPSSPSAAVTRITRRSVGTTSSSRPSAIPTASSTTPWRIPPAQPLTRAAAPSPSS